MKRFLLSSSIALSSPMILMAAMPKYCGTNNNINNNCETTSNGSVKIHPGFQLNGTNEYIVAVNNQTQKSYMLIMQHDGNAVIYECNLTRQNVDGSYQFCPNGAKVRWASDTSEGNRLNYQEDNNFVLYADQVDGSVRVPFSSKTSNAEPQYDFYFQNDGNLVMYEQGSGRAVWSSDGEGDLRTNPISQIRAVVEEVNNTINNFNNMFSKFQ